MFYKMLGNKFIASVCIVFVLTFINACQTKQLYEQNTIYPNHSWASKQVNEYSFTITDTSAAYNVFFVIRHHNAYHYKNIFIQLNTTSPDNTITKQSADLNLVTFSGFANVTGFDTYTVSFVQSVLPARHTNQANVDQNSGLMSVSKFEELSCDKVVPS